MLRRASLARRSACVRGSQLNFTLGREREPRDPASRTSKNAWGKHLSERLFECLVHKNRVSIRGNDHHRYVQVGTESQKGRVGPVGSSERERRMAFTLARSLVGPGRTHTRTNSDAHRIEPGSQKSNQPVSQVNAKVVTTRTSAIVRRSEPGRAPDRTASKRPETATSDQDAGVRQADNPLAFHDAPSYSASP